MVTNNEKLITAAKRNYDKFLVPTSFVGAKKRKRRYTSEEKADLDIKTSVNKIGEIKFGLGVAVMSARINASNCWDIPLGQSAAKAL